MSKIIYTHTDEAPALATASLLPIVKSFANTADIDIELMDISLSGRIIANFPEYIKENQKQINALDELGKIAKTPNANIIKLPNISASIPQLVSAITELQSHGYDIPDYPSEPKTDEEIKIQNKYAKILGSAVNPVLREGNSDRRVAQPVKEYAKKHPHHMGQWSSDSKTRVMHMDSGDFYGSEQSRISKTVENLSVVLETVNNEKIILKNSINVIENEVFDVAVMSNRKLCNFLESAIDDAKKENSLLSLHLKATMMKVSDPVIFGHAVKVYFKDVFKKYEKTFTELNINPNNGIGSVYAKIKTLPDNLKNEIELSIENTYKNNASLAMVDSDKGITNLHVPSDIIIDASMPAAIRSAGKMWGADGKLHDTTALIPDRSYAGVYQETIEFCKKHGTFDVTKMGNVSNVGLMAKKAEEYGSHDKTFVIPEDGTVKVLNANGDVIIEHSVETGDIWRMCQTKDIAIQDWIKLSIERAKRTQNPVIFWLDKEREHDQQIISKVNNYINQVNISDIQVEILSPRDAVKYTLNRVKNGLDTISATGNVLRDYLTDLFPILELGTSAKMLSIVPLLAGGGLFETGAGGSAPKHVQQFLNEGHLRWDSLGEFLATAVSLEDLAIKNKNKKAGVLAESLNQANSYFLDNNKSPSRKVGELDNRGSHFYLSLYWAQALSEQSSDIELKNRFSSIYTQLHDNEKIILEEIKQSQGSEINIGGYYHPNINKVTDFMRPSKTLNKIISSI